MKRITTLLAAILLFGGIAQAQPVSDRSIVPVAVTLNQILRMNIIDGGNIEFVFNSIDQYEDGITNSSIYDTRFNVSASMPWMLFIYSESSSFLPTDDPTNNANGMSLSHVGFSVSNTGTHAFGTELDDVSNANAGVIGLTSTAATTVIASTSSLGGNGDLNTGGIADNAFTIHWECGTGATASMHQTSLIDMGYRSDRYVSNIVFELATSSDL